MRKTETQVNSSTFNILSQLEAEMGFDPGSLLPLMLSICRPDSRPAPSNGTLCDDGKHPTSVLSNGVAMNHVAAEHLKCG